MNDASTQEPACTFLYVICILLIGSCWQRKSLSMRSDYPEK